MTTEAKTTEPSKLQALAENLSEALRELKTDIEDIEGKFDDLDTDAGSGAFEDEDELGNVLDEAQGTLSSNVNRLQTIIAAIKAEL